MNRLHDLIFQTRINGLWIDNSLLDSCDQWTYDAVLRMSAKAICFDFGDADFFSRIVPSEIYRQPYPIIWGEFDCINVHEERFKAGVLMEEHEDGKAFSAFCFFVDKKHGNKWKLIAVYFAERHDNEWKIQSIPSREDNADVALPSLMFRAYEAMRCVNIETTEEKPGPINVRKANARQVPIFSTWTLRIKQEHKQIVRKGGTHASPRVHLRRGHVRQLATGKTTWVQPCVVRGKSPGIVLKDYELRA